MRPFKFGAKATRGMNMATGGTFHGPRLRGSVRAGGGDTFTVRSSGSIRLDVRLVLTCDDGAHILMTFGGVATPEQEGMALRIAPRFEAPDGEHAWLNDVQAVGWGEVVDSGVRFDVWALGCRPARARGLAGCVQGAGKGDATR